MEKLYVSFCLLITSISFAQQIPGKCQEGKYGEQWVVGENIGILECKSDNSWHYRGLVLKVEKEAMRDISFYWKFEPNVDIWESNMFFICRKNKYGEYEKVISADFSNEYEKQALDVLYKKAEIDDIIGILVMKAKY